MSVLRRVLTGIDAINRWAGMLVGYWIIIMILVLIYEVILRYIFNEPTNFAHELTLYLFGSYFILLGGFALYSKAHIAMDLLYGRWSPRTKAIADIITSLLFIFFCGTLFWVGGEYAWGSFMRFEHSRTAWGPPIWPFKMMIPVGALLILLSGMTKFIRDLHMAIRGKEL